MGEKHQILAGVGLKHAQDPAQSWRQQARPTVELGREIGVFLAQRLVFFVSKASAFRVNQYRFVAASGGDEIADLTHGLSRVGTGSVNKNVG